MLPEQVPLPLKKQFFNVSVASPLKFETTNNRNGNAFAELSHHQVCSGTNFVSNGDLRNS